MLRHALLAQKLMRNLKLTLAYDGTAFAGWQVQPSAGTIQGTLQQCIRRITNENVLPQGSGRTDAGVHALAQVATVAIAAPIPAENFAKALNDVLPAAIRVLAVEEVAASFHARKSATAKTYHYRILRSGLCSPFQARYVWHYPYPLNEAAMIAAASVMEGEHDFTSFAAVDPERMQGAAITASGSNTRTIFSSEWRRDGEYLIYRVRGRGFLHHMVRNLVGTFVLVGKGTLDRDDLVSILTAKSRSAAGATAPASGLFLESVEY